VLNRQSKMMEKVCVGKIYYYERKNKASKIYYLAVAPFPTQYEYKAFAVDIYFAKALQLLAS